MANAFFIQRFSYAAPDTSLGVTLCDAVSTPDVIVTSPISGSTVSNPAVILAGTADRTSQIDIYYNDVLSQSVAIGQNPAFSLPLTLPTGTTTIKLDAYFSCNHTHSTQSLAVTFEPAVTPGPPPSTNTPQPGKVISGQGGQVSNPNHYNIFSPVHNVSTSGNETPLNKNSPIDRAKNNLGFGGNAQNTDGKDQSSSIVRPIYTWTSLILALVALAMVIFPLQVLGLLTTHFIHKDLTKRRFATSNIIIRLAALFIAVIFGIIVQL